MSRDERRRWASGRELDLIEQLAFAYRAQLPHAGFLRILPVAVDANVLLNAAARVAIDRPSDLLRAARLGLIRVYVGETILDEVEEHIPERASKAGVSAQELERVWRSEIRPRLRVVDTATIEHPDLDAIIARDPDDRATAVLSLFIGARLTWSSDSDLRAGGYAERLNVEIIVAAHNAGQFDLSAHFAVNLSTAGLESAGRALTRALDHPGPERNVAILGLLLVVGVLTVAWIKDAERVKEAASRFAAFGVEAFQELATYRTESGARLPAPVPPTSEALPLRLAHALAFAPAPLRLEEVVSVLAATGAPVAAREVLLTLESYPAFVTGRDGWQLGSW